MTSPFEPFTLPDCIEHAEKLRAIGQTGAALVLMLERIETLQREILQWSERLDAQKYELKNAMWALERVDGDARAFRAMIQHRINVKFSGHRFSVSKRDVFDVCQEAAGDLGAEIRACIAFEAGHD